MHDRLACRPIREKGKSVTHMCCTVVCEIAHCYKKNHVLREVLQIELLI